MRREKFQNGYYYHIFNRGVDKRVIFLNQQDYIRFLWSLRIFNTTEAIGSIYEKHHLGLQRGVRHPIGCRTPQRKKLVEFMSYSLLPNHFHLLLKQVHKNGISLFMKKISGGYTNYFNKKYNRSGALFQGAFKSIEVNTDGYLWRLSSYINTNAEIHKISSAEKWVYSSYPDYLNKRNGNLCHKNIILKDFQNIEDYKNFTKEIIQESQEIKDELKKYFIEN